MAGAGAGALGGSANAPVVPRSSTAPKLTRIARLIVRCPRYFRLHGKCQRACTMRLSPFFGDLGSTGRERGWTAHGHGGQSFPGRVTDFRGPVLTALRGMDMHWATQHSTRGERGGTSWVMWLLARAWPAETSCASAGCSPPG